MITETTNNDRKSMIQRPIRRHKRQPQDDKYFVLRNVLNIIFMLGAIVGAIFYFTADGNTVGTIIILAAMTFKIAECCFRFIH